jgi:hypothetical protein
MTARFSAGLRNYVAQNGSYRNAMLGGVLRIYSGTQPSTAEAAPTGTLLATITDTAGAHTDEVRAQGTVTLTGGASGSVDAITVNGVAILPAAISFNTSLTQTAADVASAINNNQSIPEWSATSSGAVITITAMYGLGATANGYVVATTVTTITKTDVNVGTATAGVTEVNGLDLSSVAAGVLSKNSTQTWSGVASASGTAGWFRFTSAVADSGALDSTETQVRIDGAVSTSGQQLNMSSTSITSAATQTISSFDITLPTS